MFTISDSLYLSFNILNKISIGTNGKIKDKKIMAVIFINSDKMETRIERIDRANYLWTFYDSMVCWSIYFPMYC